MSEFNIVLSTQFSNREWLFFLFKKKFIMWVISCSTKPSISIILRWPVIFICRRLIPWHPWSLHCSRMQGSDDRCWHFFFFYTIWFSHPITSFKNDQINTRLHSTCAMLKCEKPHLKRQGWRRRLNRKEHSP